MRQTTRIVVNLRISEEALARVDALAKSSQLNRSDVLRSALAAGLPLVEQRVKEPKV